MQRELGIFETAATLSNDHAAFVVVAVVRLDGVVAVERLRGALDVLQRWHAPLAVRIVERSGRFFYEPEGTPPIPLRVVERSGEEDWWPVAEAEVNERVDSAVGPLLRCVYVRPPGGEGGEGQSELMVTFHHAIMDEVSGAEVLGELLEMIQPGVQAGEAGAAGDEERSYPELPPVEELFPPVFRGLRGRARVAGFLGRQVVDEVGYRFHSRGTRRPEVAERFRCRILPVGLSREETSALVRQTRRRRVTVNGALSAAFLLAVRRHLYGGERPDRPLPMRYMTFADLRPYLDPPVSDGALGSLISMLRYTTDVEPGRPHGGAHGGPDGGASAGDGPFWPLARRVTEQVATGFRRGDKYCALLLAETMMRQVLGQRRERMAVTAVSYGGATRVGALSEPGEGRLGMRGMHAFVSNFEVGPEYTAQARIVDGALQLDVVYLDSDMDAELAGVLAEEILGILRSAGEA